MIVEAQANPRLARKVIEKVRTITDLPIKFVTLTHYHAVRVLGASAYGAQNIIMSDKARAMVAEDAVDAAIWSTRDFIASTYDPVRRIMARGIETPRIWTAERDRQMWDALQGG